LVFVDAKDEAAKTYYERFGFVSLEETPWNCSCHCPPSASLSLVDGAIRLTLQSLM